MDEQEWEHDPVPICASTRIIITIMVQYALKFIVVVFCVLFVPGSCTGILAQYRGGASQPLLSALIMDLWN